MYEDESANALSEDGSLDQTVPSLGSPSHSSPSSQPGLEHIERFSRKVFVGGLPPDIDEGMGTVLFGVQMHEETVYCRAEYRYTFFLILLKTGY